MRFRAPLDPLAPLACRAATAPEPSPLTVTHAPCALQDADPDDGSPPPGYNPFLAGTFSITAAAHYFSNVAKHMEAILEGVPEGVSTTNISLLSHDLNKCEELIPAMQGAWAPQPDTA